VFPCWKGVAGDYYTADGAGMKLLQLPKVNRVERALRMRALPLSAATHRFFRILFPDKKSPGSDGALNCLIKPARHSRYSRNPQIAIKRYLFVGVIRRSVP
jgi:hypothetical protein